MLETDKPLISLVIDKFPAPFGKVKSSPVPGIPPVPEHPGSQFAEVLQFPSADPFHEQPAAKILVDFATVSKENPNIVNAVNNRIFFIELFSFFIKYYHASCT